jgi:hypothetical protein
MPLTTNQGPTELPILKTWDPRLGWQSTRRWRGTLDTLATAVNTLQASGYRITIEPDPDSPYATLSATVAGPEDGTSPDTSLLTTWALLGNDLEKDTIELPKVQAALVTLSDSGLSNFRKDLQAALDAFTPPDATPFALDAIMTGLYRSKLRGVESYAVSQFVLRRTTFASVLASYKPSLANIGRIYTTAALTAAEQIPNTLRFDLPDGYWLKRTPTWEQQDADRAQITQEWWHAESYDPFIYDTATS